MSEAQKVRAAKTAVNDAVSAWYAKPTAETFAEMKRAKAYLERLRKGLGQ